VQTVRELRFTRPVAVNPIDDATMDRKLSKAFDETYPTRFYARRTQAWRTIGVIPPGADIREALLAFQTGQVVGFYNPADGELVYLSGGDLLGSLTERVILAHELTHAIDDQHFDLTRIDDIVATCDDEAFQSALGAVEGSAQHFAFAVAARFPGGTIDPADGGLPAGVPPFITQLQLWPYTAGQIFVDALAQRGGVKAVNGAIETFPLSTEQVIHPERYPNDVPQPVDVPDLSGVLGDGWRDLDVMTVGEAWLQTMLRLRLDHGTADDAAAGWDGGTYRAWTDGDAVAVVMTTVWDSDADARAFADAAQTWIDEGDIHGFVTGGEQGAVRLGFATDEATLSNLRSALGA
jgi:hypothetical protein